MRFGFVSNAIRDLATCMLIVAAGALSQPSYAGRLMQPGTALAPAAAGAPALTVKATASAAQVIEFYHAGLENFFITADPTEQAFVDSGAVGAWQRTGNTFQTGGPNQVCRFYGNTNINPATGTIYGPNSHFYTADVAECAGLKAQFNPNAKSWKFESNDFLTTAAVNGTCPAGLVPVYRAYNNGFARGIDSNHRITSNQADYLQTVAAGWIGEGIVMCAPAEPGTTLPAQLAACGETDCANITPLGNGTGFVNVIVEIANTSTAPVELIIPAGQTFVATTDQFQDGLAIEVLRSTIAPGTTGRFVLRLFCTSANRSASTTGASYAPGAITTNAQLLDIIALAAGKLGGTLDPGIMKASGVQFAVWEITNGSGALSATSRNLLITLLATAADDLMTQTTLFEQLRASLSQPS